MKGRYFVQSIYFQTWLMRDVFAQYGNVLHLDTSFGMNDKGFNMMPFVFTDYMGLEELLFLLPFVARLVERCEQ